MKSIATNLHGIALLVLFCLGCTKSVDSPSVTPERDQPPNLSAMAIITAVSPSSGPIYGNTVIKVVGLSFAEGAQVYFGSVLFKFVVPSSYVLVVSPTELYAMVPPFFAGKVDVSVLNPNSDYGIAWGSYTYMNPPPAPIPKVGATLQSGETLGVVYNEANYLDLLPAGEESDLDIKFQFGFSRIASSSFFGGNFTGSHDPSGRNDTVGFCDPRSHKVQLKYTNSPGDSDFSFQFDTGSTARIEAFAGDFDGDGVDTVGAFDALTGEVQLKNSNTGGPADLKFIFGSGSKFEVALAGDWDGDGIDTLGIYNGVTNEVRLRNSNSEGAADIVFSFGELNFLPIVGDWNNDGKDTISFLDRSAFRFLLKNTLDNSVPERITMLTPTSSAISGVAGRWKPGSSSAYTGYAWSTATPASQRIDSVKLDAAFSASMALEVTLPTKLIQSQKA
ncbi:MAG: IPT/TIG domain-containing protein [Bdellovibrionia bacterium]